MSVDKQNTNDSRVGFWVAMLAAILLLMVATVLVTASLVRSATKHDGVDRRISESKRKAILAVADFPTLAKRVVREATGTAPNPLLVKKTEVEKPHWLRSFPAPQDDGYLLFAGVDPEVKHSVVKLIRIADGQVLARWTPDWDAVFAQLSEKKWEPTGQSSRAVAFHPVLLDNGDIIFNTRSGMVRSSLCSNKPVWVLDKAIHHSNEVALDGASIWSPSIAEGYFSGNKLLDKRLRDDSLARISFDGQVLENHSIAKILMENGLQGLLLGASGHAFNDDPIHLNHISVAHTDSAYWQRGDLLLTARHPSAVLLYRPSTGKIVWYRVGPWLNQHAARFVDDRRISIFDNNVYSGAPESQPFIKAGDTNRVLIYDFATQAITEPYAVLLAEAQPVTWTQGLAQVLPDGGLFLEETNFGRHLRFTRDKLLWSRVNDYDERHIGIAARSRYLSPQEAKKPLAGIAARQCAKG